MSHTFAPNDVLHYYGECNLSLHPIKTTDSSYQEDVNCVFGWCRENNPLLNNHGTDGNVFII